MAEKYTRRRRSRRSINQTEIVDPVQVNSEPKSTVRTSSEPETEVEGIFSVTPEAAAINDINELRSEFTDSARAFDPDPLYSDDTHDWLDGGSPEYANFLGSFE